MGANNSQVIGKVSELSGVDAETCGKVLKAFEQVMQDELGASQGVGGVLEKLGTIINLLGGNKK